MFVELNKILQIDFSQVSRSASCMFQYIHLQKDIGAMNKSNLEIFSKQIADLSKILYICIYIL